MDKLIFRFADLNDLPLIIETRKKVMLADNWRSENFDESVKAEEKNIPLLMDGDPDGEFALWAVLNSDWYDPMLEFSSRNKDEIVETLEKWLWEDFMPVRFIDRDNGFKDEEND